MFYLVCATIPTESHMLAQQLRTLARPRLRLISTVSKASSFPSRIFASQRKTAPSRATPVHLARYCTSYPSLESHPNSATPNNDPTAARTMASNPFTRIVVEEMRTL